jgi:hypothetical protein
LDAWSRTAEGADDLEVWQRLARTLPAGSARRALALDRVRQLAEEYGPPPRGEGHAHRRPGRPDDATWMQRRRD